MGDVEVLESDDEGARGGRHGRAGGSSRKLKQGIKGGIAGRVLGGLRQEGRAVLKPAPASSTRTPLTARSAQTAGASKRQAKLLASLKKGVFGRVALAERAHKPQLVPAEEVRPRAASGSSTAKVSARTAAESAVLSRLRATLGGDPAARRIKGSSALAAAARQALRQKEPAGVPADAAPRKRRATPSPSSPSVVSEAAVSHKRPRTASQPESQLHAVSSKAFAPQVADNPEFQAVIHSRLKELCGEFHDDAEVLAEYIFIMIKGNKSSQDMVEELMPFLEDQDAAETFVSWVQETKATMQTNGSRVTAPASGMPALRPAAARKGAKGARRPQPAVQRQAAPAARSYSSASSTGDESGPNAKPALRPRPLTAVTAKCVLRPHPELQDLDKQAVDSISSSSASSAPPRRPLVATSLVGAAPRRPPPAPAQFYKTAPNVSKAAVKRDKKELLANMTKQLQVILTKLSDRDLTDDVREKYQALAQTIQLQMNNLSNDRPTTVTTPTKGHMGRHGR
mmetsp:Transcript_24017/g.55440  ORF Transcript_24017/g.55440 Transcript_24017/m.55440 type:complete len:512 (+) Transcript_24017:99-1634(+)